MEKDSALPFWKDNMWATKTDYARVSSLSHQSQLNILDKMQKPLPEDFEGLLILQQPLK